MSLFTRSGRKQGIVGTCFLEIFKDGDRFGEAVTIDFENRDLGAWIEFEESGIKLFATFFDETDGEVGVRDLLDVQSDTDTPRTGATPVGVEHCFLVGHS